MKYIGALIFLAITLFSYGQSSNKFNGNKLNLQKSLISQIEISNYCGPMDSCRTITYNLTTAMTEGLVERLNKSDTAEPCEFTNLYWLQIYFMDSTARTFITNGFLFNEIHESDEYPVYTTIVAADDLCLKITDTDYIKKLWLELADAEIR